MGINVLSPFDYIFKDIEGTAKSPTSLHGTNLPKKLPRYIPECNSMQRPKLQKDGISKKALIMEE